MTRVRLGINIDHVATVRNARGGTHPDPVRAAHLAAQAGADGITAHLREDRRHITDVDIARLRAQIGLPLNLEMAATEEMLEIALRTKPHACCLVPERRAERTTEGGLEVAQAQARLRPFVARLRDAGIRVSLFVAPQAAQIEAAKAVAADIVELHTGAYCEHTDEARAAELRSIQSAVKLAAHLGLECHAGHGLSYDTAGAIAAIPGIRELNIGHFLIGEAVFTGLENAVQHMRRVIDNAAVVNQTTS